MLGESCFGETCYAEALQPTGVTIIPEIASLTRDLVLVFEADLIQPHMTAAGS